MTANPRRLPPPKLRSRTRRRGVGDERLGDHEWQSVTAAVLQADNKTVALTTSSQLPAVVYVVACAAGNVADIVGNTNGLQTASFSGYTVSLNPPATVSASAGTTSPVIATVTWSASSGGVAGYRVWRCTTAAGTFESIGTTTSTQTGKKIAIPRCNEGSGIPMSDGCCPTNMSRPLLSALTLREPWCIRHLKIVKMCVFGITLQKLSMSSLFH